MCGAKHTYTHSTKTATQSKRPCVCPARETGLSCATTIPCARWLEMQRKDRHNKSYEVDRLVLTSSAIWAPRAWSYRRWGKGAASLHPVFFSTPSYCGRLDSCLFSLSCYRGFLPPPGYLAPEPPGLLRGVNTRGERIKDEGAR